MLRTSTTFVLLAIISAISCKHEKEIQRPQEPAFLEKHLAFSREKKPNIILISMDALRYDRTGLHASNTGKTPHLKSFAQEAIVFHQVISPSSWTVPSHMSIWTGLYPTKHGMVNKLRSEPGSTEPKDAALAPSIATFPDKLIQSGWTSVAFTGGAGVSARFGFGRSFSVYLDDRKFAGFDYSVAPALKWLQANQSTRFFMFLHGYDVHGQHDLSGLEPRKVVPSYQGKLTGSLEEQAHLREKGLQNTRMIGEPASLLGVINEADGQFLSALYDKKIEQADERLGKFIGEVKSMGLWDNSIIAIVSDHGEEFFEHGHIDHGHSLYEEQLHTVMLIHLPKMKERWNVSEPVSSIDLFPTIFDVLSLDGPPNVDGRSLLPLLLQGQEPRMVSFAETDYRLYVHHRMVRRGHHKYVADLRSGKRWLFDLALDPNERVNVRNREQNLAKEFEELLQKQLQSIGTSPGAYYHLEQEPIKIF